MLRELAAVYGGVEKLLDSLAIVITGKQTPRSVDITPPFACRFSASNFVTTSAKVAVPQSSVPHDSRTHSIA